MPYVGGSLTTLFDETAQMKTRNLAKTLAHKGGRRMETLARANTPVRTGELRASWYRTPVVEIDALLGRAYRVTVANDTDYAAWVENGTGIYGPEHRPYVIVPKDPMGTLAWRDPKTGKMIFAKRVLHPGSPGNHMLAIAAHVVEYELDTGVLGGREVAAWARSIETGAR
jgi:hypothetical protein